MTGSAHAGPRRAQPASYHSLALSALTADLAPIAEDHTARPDPTLTAVACAAWPTAPTYSAASANAPAETAQPVISGSPGTSTRSSHPHVPLDANWVCGCLTGEIVASSGVRG